MTASKYRGKSELTITSQPDAWCFEYALEQRTVPRVEGTLTIRVHNRDAYVFLDDGEIRVDLDSANGEGFAVVYDADVGDFRISWALLASHGHERPIVSWDEHVDIEDPRLDDDEPAEILFGGDLVAKELELDGVSAEVDAIVRRKS